MYSIAIYREPHIREDLGVCPSFISATMRMFYLLQKTHTLVSAADYGNFYIYFWQEGKKPAIRVVIWKED